MAMFEHCRVKYQLAGYKDHMDKHKKVSCRHGSIRGNTRAIVKMCKY